MRKIFAAIWLLILLSAIGTLFWYTDIIYSLPTPLPANYTPVETGTFINLPAGLAKYSGKPLFVHFYNPGCPCSRFNRATFKKLAIKYNMRVNFVIVVLSTANGNPDNICKKFDFDVPVIFDKSFAKTCGVYSTPQAVLIDQQHKLYYRGNYNTGRYCTNQQTNFADIAVNDLLTGNRQPVFNPLALKAYGCSLPGCKK